MTKLPSLPQHCTFQSPSIAGIVPDSLHHWELTLFLGRAVTGQGSYRLPKELRLEKNTRIQRLRLSAGRQISLSRQKREKALDSVIAKLGWMPLPVEDNEELYLVQVRIYRASTVPLNPHVVFNGFEKGRLHHV